MNILAHRGYWGHEIKRNSPEAIVNALKNGFGFESDIRDYCGNLVISHDIATDSSQKVDEVFRELSAYDDKYTFAINVKSDGLKIQLKELLDKYSISNYFVFDMSIPQMIEYKDYNLTFFTRQSEVEKDPCMYEEAAGVWVDAFWSTEWIDKDLIYNHLENKKKVCIVSPELHQVKDYKLFWDKLKGYKINDIMLCTDYPDEAKEFFDE